MSKIHLGKPWPLGSSITSRGINFCVAAPGAHYIELLLFEHSNDNHPAKTIKLNDENRSGDYWHIEVEGIGSGCLYSYRVFKKSEAESQSSYNKKILLDPCARGISGWDLYKRKSANGDSDNIHSCLKGVVCERNLFDFNAHPRPRHKWEESVIYELHLEGFTRNKDSKIESDKKGTFHGLIEKIPYLKDIGITAIELLPIFSFDPTDCPEGVENYWGYSPINWFTPHHRYLADQNPLKAREQVRALVAACHDVEIEVILDVVYNHTTEGDKNGPVISWKGFSESLYYYQSKKGKYLDVSGCGNSIAANRPLVRQLILESMRCWANELGIDGFRFDLGIALSRGEDLTPLSTPPLFEEIESDPTLSDLKLISEPWDCGGLYRLADFPSKKIKTWNGHFRDDLRKFWKGESNSVWPLKDRLRGSMELYKNEKAQFKGINFITSHDGFTLHDLVSFNIKHNLANGESNRDGENHNNSWNHSIEGPSTDIKLSLIRKRQAKNLLASLLLSPGTPMLLMGDEVGRSQGGNNNAWCQNNCLGWMIWDPKKCDLDLHQFVKRLITIRKQLPEIFNPTTLQMEKDRLQEDEAQGLWMQWHGIKLNKPDWGHWSHTISYSINNGSKGAAMWMGLNAYSKSMKFELPYAISSWERLLNTACISADDLRTPYEQSNQKMIELESRSLVILLSKEYAAKFRP